MPKVISYTPAWLSRPSAGFDLFSGKGNAGEESSKALSKPPKGLKTGRNSAGSRRTIARRGTEVFVVDGNTIRWTDLCMLKDDWESRRFSKSTRIKSERTQSEESESQIFQGTKYKVLKVPVHEQIQQLIPSPNNELLAIVTSHTIHIAILPDSSHLDQPDSGPIRVKTHTLGPTTHVLSQARLREALWHPLGINGECLVTITEDAVVRMWELNRENRWSFDKPTLEVDLRKLHYADSLEDDVGAADWGTNRGFSVDALGMEVASSCFGGTASEEESGWSSMTLWIAMSEGDVFALCPLLPSKWQPSTTLVPSLTTTIAAKKNYAEGVDLSTEEEQAYTAQYQWLAELDKQDPVMLRGKNEFASEIPVYSRPNSLGAIPELQGPFRIIPGDIEDDLDIAGIHVIASKLDAEELIGAVEEGELFDVPETDGLSTSIVCLLTNTGRVYICLNLVGVEGQWLPLKKPRMVYAPDADNQPELVLLEVLDTRDDSDEEIEGESPTFTPDIHSRYSFFVTHSRGSFFLSVDPWLDALESELQGEGTAGVAFRLGILMKSSHTLRQRLIRFERSDPDATKVAASVVFQDSDLGYFLLTSYNDRPYSALLDSPQEISSQDIKESPVRDPSEELLALTAAPRLAYEPPDTFYTSIPLASFFDSHITKRHKSTLKDEIRLSSSTLETMTQLHRFLSQETHRLGISVAELFSRCERIRTDFSNQLHRVNDISDRIKRINDEDVDECSDDDSDQKVDSLPKGSAKIEERFRKIREKQEELLSRHDALRRKTAGMGVKPLSDKELAWSTELKKLETSLLPPGEGKAEKGGRKIEHWERVSEARELAQELLAQAKDMTADTENSPTPPSSSDGGKAPSRTGFKVPPDVRKNKVAQVMGLLERETALVDAAQERLQRLGISAT